MSGNRQVLVSDPDGLGAQILNAAPGADTGQKALAVRIISALLGTVDISDRAGRLLGVVTANAGSGPFPVSDNAGSLTVDAPVTTPVFTRVSDGTAVLIGQRAMVNSLPVVLASDQTSIPVTESGTWTVQPGNTQNTTPWLVAENLVNVAQGAAVPANVDMAGIRNSAGNADRIQGLSDNADGVATTAGGNAVRGVVMPFFFNGTTYDRLRGDATSGLLVKPTPSLVVVTGTAAVNTALTVTLPAVAGQFHYITSIQIVKLYSVVGVANGAGNIITTTNISGNPAWTTEQLASAAGSAPVVLDFNPTTPLKSTTVNTNTTIVCPQQLQTIWRVNVTYFTGP